MKTPRPPSCRDKPGRVPLRCRVCRHRDRSAIESSLLAGSPLRSVAERFGPSKSALMRHVEDGHISARLAKAHAAVEVLGAEALLDRVLRFQREAEAILVDARRGGRDGAALAAIGKLTELLKVEGAATQAARESARQSADTLCHVCRGKETGQWMTLEEALDREEELGAQLRASIDCDTNRVTCRQFSIARFLFGLPDS